MLLRRRLWQRGGWDSRAPLAAPRLPAAVSVHLLPLRSELDLSDACPRRLESRGVNLGRKLGCGPERRAGRTEAMHPAAGPHTRRPPLRPASSRGARARPWWERLRWALRPLLLGLRRACHPGPGFPCGCHGGGGGTRPHSAQQREQEGTAGRPAEPVPGVEAWEPSSLRHPEQVCSRGGVAGRTWPGTVPCVGVVSREPRRC